MKRITILVFLCSVILSPAYGQDTQDKTNFMYYWEKGNAGKTLTKEDRKYLIDQVDNKMRAFVDAYNTLEVSEGNFSYSTGKGWEITLDTNKQSHRESLSTLDQFKKYPDSLILTVRLYVIMNHMVESGSDAARIEKFYDRLKGTQMYLSVWKTAFEKTHLRELSIKNDTKYGHLFKTGK